MNSCEVIARKIKFQGLSSLSDTELLSLLLGKGVASEDSLSKATSLIKIYGNISAILSLDRTTMCREVLIGDKHAAIIALFGEFVSRGYFDKNKEIEIVHNTADVERIFMPMLANLPYEEFWLLCLNGTNRVLDKVKVGQGGIDGVLVDVRIIMRNAIDNLATSIILVHNHPSGSLEASSHDISLTRKIKDASKIFNIKFLEHVVITSEGSFEIKI